MATFLIRHTVKPAPTHPNYGQFSGAYAALWVVDDDQEHAEKRAYDYLQQYGWLSQTFQDIRVVTRDVHEYDPTVLAQFDKAQRLGIAAEFAAYTGGGVQFN